MPNSEVYLPESSAALSPEPPANLRAFFWSACSIVLLGLCSMAFLNWFENPFGTFHPPSHPHLNDQQSLAFRNSARGGQMRWLSHLRLPAGTDALLLGNSQVLYGIGSCKFPRMERVAIFDFNNAEMAQFLRDAGSSLQPGTTLYLQQSILVRKAVEPAFSSGWHRQLQDLLDPQTTSLAFANLLASMEAKSPPCAAIRYDLDPRSNVMTSAHLTEALLHPKDYKPMPDGIDRALNAIIPLCATKKLQVVFFTLPTFFPQDARPVLLSSFAENAQRSQKAIAIAQEHAQGCQIQFIDLATAYLQANPAGAPTSDWYDLKHFKPFLGTFFLNSLARQSQLGMTVANAR